MLLTVSRFYQGLSLSLSLSLPARPGPAADPQRYPGGEGHHRHRLPHGNHRSAEGHAEITDG